MGEQDLFRARVRGAGRRATSLRGAARALQNELNRVIRDLGQRAEEVYGHPAPVPTARGSATLRDTGATLDSVHSYISFRAGGVRARVTINAVRDGFDHLDAMRFGQETDPILAKRYDAGRRGFMSVHLAGRDSPAVRLRSVRAFRPMLDFVEESHIRFAPEVDDAEQHLLRTIDTVFIPTR